MDKSNMAKPGVSHDWDFFKNDKGRPKVSRKVESPNLCECEGHCMCRKDHTGDPLSDHNPGGGGKMY